ncbi:MAG: insulinase family protein [Candidatus Aminicenantes bacterium]|nr:insulinase family protein [Candidatus Aminicenantes bacterium]
MKHKSPFFITFLLIILSFRSLYGAEKVFITKELSLIFDRDISSTRTIIQIFIRGGKKAEPAQQLGLAYLTTRLAVEIHDTVKRKKIIQMGSRIGFQIEDDFCVISINCLSRYLAETLEIFSEIFNRPLFSSLRTNRIKKHLNYFQKSEQDNDITLMELSLREAFFGSSGYGGSIYGDSESIKRIKPKHISRFHKQYFSLNNMTIAVSSDLEISKIKGSLLNIINDFPAGEKNKSVPATIKIPEKREYFIKKERKQTLVAVGVCSDLINPQHAAHTFLLENLIGKGLGSKLWLLREKEKLAYLVNATIIQMKDMGILSIYLKTDKVKKEDAYQKLNQLVLDLYETEITQSELDMHKNYAKADFLILNESKANRAYNLAFFQSLGLGYQYLESLEKEIDKIDINDFNSFKKEVLNPENLVRVIIGPENNEVKSLNEPKNEM